ncbi:MAG: hypothetical protein KJ058_04785 [Thermoanaerobaculia bacterium]|nr:hypothetical protein [Thermoanaerobaculia bacterium]
MSGRFSYSLAVSPLHDEAAVARLVAGLAPALAAAGGEASDPEAAPRDRPLAHVVLTGGTERIVLARIEARAAAGGREPVVLVAHPGHNSLPACLDLLARVRADGGTGRIVFLAGEDGDAARLGEAVHLAGVALALRRARIGALGEPSEWLVASAHGAEAVAATWGPELVPLPLSEITSRLPAEGVDAEGEVALIGAARASAVAASEVARAGAVHAVLADLVAAHRLSAVTVRCFDLVAGSRTTGCLALSRLADDGVPAGCEGDVPSAVALLWIQLLTGEAAWMANPARIAPERGELLLAHCTVPRRLVTAFDLTTHFESDLGVALAGDLAPGPVTLVRLGGRRLERIWLAEGELTASPHEPGLCRTQALVTTNPEALAELLRDPLGNHVVLVPGHRAAQLGASRDLILAEPA